MQNRANTIEERLQIINDYIQRTMDALNATRQVVQGLSTTVGYGQQSGFVGPQIPGLNHSSQLGIPQIVQTPYGYVTLNPQFSGPTSPYQVNPMVNPMSPYGIGGVGGYGLSHGSWGQQVPSWGTQIPGWPMNVGQLPLGVGQGQLGQVPQPFGYGFTGLNHTPFVPTFVSPWNVPVTPQYPFPGTVGFNPYTQGQQSYQGVSPQTTQGIPGIPGIPGQTI